MVLVILLRIVLLLLIRIRIRIPALLMVVVLPPISRSLPGWKFEATSWLRIDANREPRITLSDTWQLSQLTKLAYV